MEGHDSYVPTLDVELMAKAKELWGEDEHLRDQTLKIIREWIKQQPHFNCRTDAGYLIVFARGCKYSLEKMKRKLDMLLTLKTALPEFFTGCDPLKPELQAALNVGMQLPVPGYDVHGRKVVIIRGGCFNPRDHRPEDLEKANFMVMECLGKQEERVSIGGLVIVIDMEGTTMAHIMHKPLPMLKKQMKYIQDAVPFSPKAIIFIRTSSSFSTMWNISQTILNDKMKQRVHVLGNDLDAFKKMISSSSLPSDYGGDGMSLKELTAHWKQKVESEREYLMSQEKYKADESKRPGKPKTSQDLFGMEGSFRKLNVD